MDMIAWARAQAGMMRLISTGLDALINLGVDITPEQYQQALVDASRRLKEEAPRSVYPEALAAAIEAHLDWQRAAYSVDIGGQRDDQGHYYG